MIRAVYIQKKLSLYLLLPILFFCNSAISQSKNEILKKNEDLKLNPQFKRENPAHIDLLLNLSREYLYKNSDSLLIVLDQAYELSVETKYREGEARALHNYGYFYSQIGESEKALEYNLKSIEVANKYNVRPQKIYALNNIALDLWSKGKNAKALTYYLEALSIAKETKNIFMTAILNNNIALLYSDNGDFDTALKFHEKALEITNNKLGKDVLGSTLLNMAVIYIEQEKFELADRTTDKCIAIFENDNSIDWMSHSYEVKGSIALALNKFKDALFWYNKSKKICDDNDFTSGYTKTYAGLAEAYIGLKDFKKAEDYALKALKISKDLDVLETVKYTYSLLSEIYHAQRQYSVAYDYQAKYITLYEKSSKESFKKGLGVLRSEMKFENQKKQLIAKNNKALAEQKLYVYLAICALVAVSIFLIFMYRTHKLQKKHTKELLLRESELEASNTTKDKLFSIIAHDLKGPINSFYSLLKMYVSGNVSKEEADFILPKAFQQIGSISEMLNNLLIWGKTQLTATNNNPNNNDINLLINDNIALLSPIAKKKSIIIKNNVTDTLKGFYDKDQINIVIRNLLNNAIKFTNVGGTITVNALENEDHIQVSVSDDGVGMDLETQTNLFNKNNYKTTYGTNNEKGTGLGLNLCQEMITVNDGVIWVTSVVNKGSTFSFKIPSKRSLKAVV